MINSLASSIVVAALLGVGVAVYETGIYGVMAAQPRKMREALLMANIQALNIGCVLGPVIGFVFVLITFNLPFILPALVLMLLAGYCSLNRSPEYNNPSQDTVVTSASRVLKDKKFLWMCLSLIPFWALFAQLFGALPVLMVRASGSDAMAGSVIFLNGFVGFFAVSVYAWLTKKIDARALAIVGCLIGAIATWFLESTVGLITLIFLVGLFSVAETFVTTAADILTSRYADGRSTGSYFSALNVSIGIGSALGAPLGMMAISQTSGAGFMMIGVTGVLSALLLFWHR
jgi:predicted MFS family arabinose efflux permease